VKKLLILIVASMASSLFLYALVSQDQPARHSGLKAADLPPLIAVHDLYAASEGAREVMAFNPGTKVAWRQAFDGSSGVTAQLTLPLANSASGPLPAVVLINSKPASGIAPDSDRTVRFLTNRGYVVLSIDCEDFTTSYQMAPDTTQRASTRCTETTIADEAVNLIDQGIADPSALAILGSGTGGYLALMAMSLAPGLFKAAIVHAAVTDQVDRVSENGFTLKPQQAVVKTGLPAVDTDQYAMSLAGESPIDLAGRIRGAILMTHGKADTVVPAERAQAYAEDLLGSQKDVEVVFFNHEDHCYARWQTRIQVARLTENFLARHLGGRNGGYDYIELLAKWF
jgi:dienelactone hydrolase